MKTELRILQSILKRNPALVRRMLFFAVAFPLFLWFLVQDTGWQLLLFTLLSYCSAMVGFVASRYADNADGDSLRKQFFRKLLVWNMEEAVIIYNCRDGRNAYVSPSFSRLLGYDTEMMQRRGLLSIIHTADIYKLMAKLPARQSNESFQPFTDTFRVLPQKGDAIWMELQARPVPADADLPLGYAMITLRDVSDRIELERSTRRFAEELMRKKHSMTNQQAYSY